MRKWRSIILKKDIARLRKGVCIRTGSFIMNAIPSNFLRVLIIASKKRVHKHAVLRNRAKRRVRGVLDNIAMPVSLDMSIVISNSVITMEYNALLRIIQDKYNECARRVYGNNIAL